MRHYGNLHIESGDRRDFSSLKEIRGDLSIARDAIFSTPSLIACKNIFLGEGSSLTAQGLLYCIHVHAYESSTFTAARVPCIGHVHLYEDASIDFPNLMRFGSLRIRAGSRFSLPQLHTVEILSLEDSCHATLPGLLHCTSIFLGKNSVLSASKYLGFQHLSRERGSSILDI